MRKFGRLLAVSIGLAVMVGATLGAPAQAVTNDCAAAATQRMAGSGLYTNDPATINRLVKNPDAPAYLFFRLKFASATCAGVTYNVIAWDATTDTRVGIGEAKGPGTFSTALQVYTIEFQVPIPKFDPTTMRPSAVCVTDVVSIDDTVVHQGPSIAENGCPFPGLFLQLNPTGGGGGEFDM